MTAAREQLDEADRDDVVRWRFEELVRAGYDPSDAMVLAGRVEVDLHAATDLVAHGCPPETAVRILV